MKGKMDGFGNIEKKIAMIKSEGSEEVSLSRDEIPLIKKAFGLTCPDNEFVHMMKKVMGKDVRIEEKGTEREITASAGIDPEFEREISALNEKGFKWADIVDHISYKYGYKPNLIERASQIVKGRDKNPIKNGIFASKKAKDTSNLDAEIKSLGDDFKKYILENYKTSYESLPEATLRDAIEDYKAEIDAEEERAWQDEERHRENLREQMSLEVRTRRGRAENDGEAQQSSPSDTRKSGKIVNATKQLAHVSPYEANINSYYYIQQIDIPAFIRKRLGGYGDPESWVMVRLIGCEANQPVIKYMGEPIAVSWDDLYDEKPNDPYRRKNPSKGGLKKKLSDAIRRHFHKKTEMKITKADDEEPSCPGSKIRSKGKGQGLGRGKGKGPIGIPLGNAKEKVTAQKPPIKTSEQIDRAMEEGARKLGKTRKLTPEQIIANIKSGKDPYYDYSYFDAYNMSDSTLMSSTIDDIARLYGIDEAEAADVVQELIHGETLGEIGEGEEEREEREERLTREVQRYLKEGDEGEEE